MDREALIWNRTSPTYVGKTERKQRANLYIGGTQSHNVWNLV